MKQISHLILALLVVVSTAASAALCPDLKSIRAGNFQRWMPLYSSDDEPASPSQIQSFRNSVQSFTGAEWNEEFLNGHGRCTYDSDEEIALAKDTPSPTLPVGKWKDTGNSKICDNNSQENCPFPDQTK